MPIGIGVVVVDFSWAARLDDRREWARDPALSATPGVGEHALHAHAIADESDAAALARLRELNAVDQRLYDEAKVLFDARFASMLAATAPAQRFRKRGGRYVLS